jgi:hypothetical protein
MRYFSAVTCRAGSGVHACALAMSPVEGAEPECGGARTRTSRAGAVQAAGHSGCAHQLASFILGRAESERNGSLLFYYKIKNKKNTVYEDLCVILRLEVRGKCTACCGKVVISRIFEETSILLLIVSKIVQYYGSG